MSPDYAIPNVFHFVFGLKPQSEPFHLMYYLCLASCLQVNQPDKIVFHYHNEPYGEWWDRIKPNLELRRIEPDSFVNAFNYQDQNIGSFRYAHLADFARLQILLEEGGVYADIDTLFIKKIPRHWFFQQFVLGREKPPATAKLGGSLCNAWIASAPGSEFCRLWLEQMQQAFDGSWSNHSTLLPYELSLRYADLLAVEPETSFYALDWTPQCIDQLFLGKVALPDQAFSLHLWNHLWWQTQRRDFSRFHGGLLTVDYVAHADTTYAILARPFLPDDVKSSRQGYWRQRVGYWLRWFF
jgi:hypothetical protein